MTLGAQHDLLEKLLFKHQVILSDLPVQEQTVANQLTRSGYLVTEHQNEFYRACRSVLPPGAHLSPNVGPVFGITGRMDFMLMPLKWSLSFQLMAKPSRNM
ncbi:TPA: hypothetical protein ACH3X1_016145 [Trebouxia sp. C0004]